MKTVRSETVYNGTDNVIDLRLRDDSSSAMVSSDLTGVSRMTLAAGGVTVDSNVPEEAGYFDWSAGEGKLSLTLGQAGFPVGSHIASLTVYDGAHPNGIRWEPQFVLEVK